MDWADSSSGVDLVPSLSLGFVLFFCVVCLFLVVFLGCLCGGGFCFRVGLLCVGWCGCRLLVMFVVLGSVFFVGLSRWCSFSLFLLFVFVCWFGWSFVCVFGWVVSFFLLCGWGVDFFRLVLRLCRFLCGSVSCVVLSVLVFRSFVVFVFGCWRHGLFFAEVSSSFFC